MGAAGSAPGRSLARKTDDEPDRLAGQAARRLRWHLREAGTLRLKARDVFGSLSEPCGLLVPGDWHLRRPLAWEPHAGLFNRSEPRSDGSRRLLRSADAPLAETDRRRVSAEHRATAAALTDRTGPVALTQATVDSPPKGERDDAHLLAPGHRRSTSGSC